MTSRYVFDEGSVLWPDGYADRSVNIFVQEPMSDGLTNLQVARDTPKSGETLDAYVDRQAGILKRKIKGLAVASRETIALAGCGADAIEIETKYHTNGKSVYQRQCAVILSSGKALVFTATNAVPFTVSQLEIWRDWIDSFVPA